MNDDEMLEILADWTDQNREAIAARYELELSDRGGVDEDFRSEMAWLMFIDELRH